MSVIGEALAVGFSGFVRTVGERRRSAREHAGRVVGRARRAVLIVGSYGCAAAGVYVLAGLGWGLIATCLAGLLAEYGTRPSA